MNNEGYQPAREPGEIVPLKALLAPKVFSPEFAAPGEPGNELKGFKLIDCRAGMGAAPYEDWRVEAIGGPHDGETHDVYVFKPGHVPK